jgi:hypothetical protein
MSCRTVRDSMAEFLDQRVAGKKRIRMARHLARCRECAMQLDQHAQMRTALQSLPVAPVPERLKMQLLVLASRERAHWNATKTWPLAWRTWSENAKLIVDNLMRPLALPFAGGILSALFLFAMLVPTLGFRPSILNDVPLALYTEATLVEATPLGVHNDEAVVELYIDRKGKAMDYSVQRGKVSPELQADLTNLMFSSTFTPATWFGQPTNGKVLVSFRRVHYVVRG